MRSSPTTGTNDAPSLLRRHDNSLSSAQCPVCLTLTLRYQPPGSRALSALMSLSMGPHQPTSHTFPDRSMRFPPFVSPT
ncbi:hypothetical protein OH76DRAFT_19573 [Lentinus brumalis]|uniref:Uncharacterized protein n=1 Tax=Lentinus brumalis TaxID=2498619 RepID=A0A371DXD3_9APHY|nr:hypothetical protein OH76DRAFT_19573 [Polyporus brumalis]